MKSQENSWVELEREIISIVNTREVRVSGASQGQEGELRLRTNPQPGATIRRMLACRFDCLLKK